MGGVRELKREVGRDTKQEIECAPRTPFQCLQPPDQSSKCNPVPMPPSVFLPLRRSERLAAAARAGARRVLVRAEVIASRRRSRAQKPLTLRISLPKRHRWPDTSEDAFTETRQIVAEQLMAIEQLPLSPKYRLRPMLFLFRHLIEQPLLLARSAKFRVTVIKKLSDVEFQIRREGHELEDELWDVCVRFAELISELPDHPSWVED